MCYSHADNIHKFSPVSTYVDGVHQFSLLISSLKLLPEIRKFCLAGILLKSHTAVSSLRREILGRKVQVVSPHQSRVIGYWLSSCKGIKTV